MFTHFLYDSTIFFQSSLCSEASLTFANTARAKQPPSISFNRRFVPSALVLFLCVQIVRQRWVDISLSTLHFDISHFSSGRRVSRWLHWCEIREISGSAKWYTPAKVQTLTHIPREPYHPYRHHHHHDACSTIHVVFQLTNWVNTRTLSCRCSVFFGEKTLIGPIGLVIVQCLWELRAGSVVLWQRRGDKYFYKLNFATVIKMDRCLVVGRPPAHELLWLQKASSWRFHSLLLSRSWPFSRVNAPEKSSPHFE